MENIKVDEDEIKDNCKILDLGSRNRLNTIGLPISLLSELRQRLRDMRTLC